MHVWNQQVAVPEERKLQSSSVSHQSPRCAANRTEQGSPHAEDGIDQSCAVCTLQFLEKHGGSQLNRFHNHKYRLLEYWKSSGGGEGV